jgi:hypothetical protein
MPTKSIDRRRADPMHEIDLLLLEEIMTRRPFKTTPLAAALQAASLLAVAAGVFGILISDITRQRDDAAGNRAPSKAQFSALPHDSDARSR